MDALAAAEHVHESASAEYAEASSAYESALMDSDPERTKEALRRLRGATDAYNRSLQHLVELRKRSAPSFEDLLRDPTVQLDVESVILASIVAHAAAVPASAGIAITGRTEYISAPQRHRPAVWLSPHRVSHDTTSLTASR